MRFNNIKHYKPEEFRRLTGVKLATFNKMVEIVTQALKEKKAKGGRPNKLSLPDMVLMTLEYLREYRPIFIFLQAMELAKVTAIILFVL